MSKPPSPACPRAARAEPGRRRASGSQPSSRRARVVVQQRHGEAHVGPTRAAGWRWTRNVRSAPRAAPLRKGMGARPPYARAPWVQHRVGRRCCMHRARRCRRCAQPVRLANVHRMHRLSTRRLGTGRIWSSRGRRSGDGRNGPRNSRRMSGGGLALEDQPGAQAHDRGSPRISSRRALGHRLVARVEGRGSPRGPRSSTGRSFGPGE